MRRICVQLIISLTLLNVCISGFGQSSGAALKPISEIVDSLKQAGFIFEQSQEKPAIELTTEQAVKFLERYYRPRFWRDANDPLRQAIEYLMFLATRPSYNSSEAFLKNYNYDSIKISWEKFYIWDTLAFKIPDSEPVSFQMVDSARFETDTVNIAAEPYNIFTGTDRLKDTSIFVITDKLREVYSTDPDLPFRYYNSLFMVDSLESAVNSLMKFLDDRDSSIVHFAGRGDAVVPVWFNSKSNSMMRYWLKNEFNDSVTVWIGSIGHDTIGLFVEQGVDFKRPMKPSLGNTEARVNVERQDRSTLLRLQTVGVKKNPWKYRTEAKFAFSQTGLFNWIKGGESSLSSLFDIISYADYNNPQKKLSSNNYARLNLGFLKSGDNDIRKNTDNIEISSKMNHKAFGKFDFSAVMLFKTQLLKGYDYPNDSIPVSKMLNPANITFGLGLDYKPNSQTSINFSPLAYKLTFVTDTAHINQTKHGIAKDKKSLGEAGVSLIASNVWKPTKTTTVSNKLTLFSNYTHNPQNIDVDWELKFSTKLNWFTELSINTRFIFDDDTKIPVLDKDKKPVLNPDGTARKTARIQFSEFVGLSLAFTF